MVIIYIPDNINNINNGDDCSIDMATPALTRFGTDELKRTFLAPSIAGDMVACLGVSEVGSGSDVASIKTTARPKKGECNAQNIDSSLYYCTLIFFVMQLTRNQGCLHNMYSIKMCMLIYTISNCLKGYFPQILTSRVVEYV